MVLVHSVYRLVGVYLCICVLTWFLGSGLVDLLLPAVTIRLAIVLLCRCGWIVLQCLFVRLAWLAWWRLGLVAQVWGSAHLDMLFWRVGWLW